jgi:hypothetical protein
MPVICSEGSMKYIPCMFLSMTVMIFITLWKECLINWNVVKFVLIDQYGVSQYIVHFFGLFITGEIINTVHGNIQILQGVN